MRHPLPPALGGGADAGSRRRRLRELLETPGPLIVPGVFDGLTAVLAERHGFDACYLTGAGLANTQMGVPDVGLVSFDAVMTQALRIVAATTVPVIVDADTGFGGPSSVMHVVRTLEQVGVAGIQLEDQEMPKRCGHFDRKSVVATSEMQAKVEAATAARCDENTLVIARTDALAVEGLDAALERGRAYRDAGADAIFIEAPVSLDEIKRIPQEIADVPLVMNVVQGGKTPELAATDLDAIGYKIVLHANLLMRAMMAAGASALQMLKETGGDTAAFTVPFLSWAERQELVRLADFDAIEDELAVRWSDGASSPGSGGERG